MLLHPSRTVPILRRIRGGLCGERFELDVGETVGLYLDWVRDLREVDKAKAANPPPAAAWRFSDVNSGFRTNVDPVYSGDLGRTWTSTYVRCGWRLNSLLTASTTCARVRLSRT